MGHAWTDWGRKPNWLGALKKGGTMDDFAI
jgi:DNA-binding protein H-NS